MTKINKNYIYTKNKSLKMLRYYTETDMFRCAWQIFLLETCIYGFTSGLFPIQSQTASTVRMLIHKAR